MDFDHIPVKRHIISHLDVYYVTEDELERLQLCGGEIGIDFQVAQFSLTLAAAFLVALLTTTINSRKTFDTFVVIVVVGFILGAAFGLKWYTNRGAFVAIVRKIKERQIGPVGEEGKELKPSDLAALPPVEPPAPQKPAGEGTK